MNEASLRSRAGRALGWSLLSTIGARFGTLAIGVALARVLGPSEFGAFAVAMVALIAMLSINELGVSLAIVRWPDDPNRIAPTVATLATVSSVIICALIMVTAPAFASIMGNPEAAGPVRVLGLSVVVNGVVSTSAAILQREFLQGKKLIADQADAWLGAVVSLVLALSQWGAMSLAVGRVCGSLAGGLLLIAFSPERLRFGYDRLIARRLVRFGLPLAGASLIVFAVSYADQMVVGHVLGPTALGFYLLAVNLSGWPVNVFSRPVRAVAPAAFARLQNDRPALNRTFLVTAGALIGLTLPMCLVLSGTAPVLIRVVYGEQWQASADVLAGLGVLAGLRIVFELIYDYLVVLERSREVLLIQMIWLVALVPAMYVGVRHGLPGAAVAAAAVAALVVLPAYLWQLSRHGIRLQDLAVQLWPGLLTALVACAAAVLAVRLIQLDLAALAAAGTVTTALVAGVLYRSRGVLRDIRETT